jgi:hypothetical protein
MENRKVGKKRTGVIVTLAGVATLTVVLPGCDSQSPGVQYCELITTIARDPDKMTYIKEWIASHLEDERFRETLRDLHTVRAEDERMQRFGDLDWKYLGIAQGIGTLSFHGALETDSGRLDVSRINGVELSVGRSSIYVRVTAEDFARQTWSPQHLPGMKAFGEDVFIDCGADA